MKQAGLHFSMVRVKADNERVGGSQGAKNKVTAGPESSEQGPYCAGHVCAKGICVAQRGSNDMIQINCNEVWISPCVRQHSALMQVVSLGKGALATISRA